MPWRIALGAPEASIAIAAVVTTTLCGQSLWQKLHHKIQPKTAESTTAARSKDELFSETDFDYIQKYCAKGPITVSTDYGEWHSTKECTLPSRGRRSITLPIDEILYANKQVTGFKRMLVTEARRSFFEKNLSISTTQESSSCSRFGQRIFPLVVVVKRDLCDALVYNQI